MHGPEVRDISDPADRERFQRDVAETAKALTGNALRRKPHALHVVQLTGELARRIDALSDQSPERSDRACRAGCSSCCYLAVSITAPEAIRVADELRNRLNPETFAALRARLAAHSRRVSHLTLEARARARVPCALLGPDGACTVYRARPFGCRGWTSFSKEACDAARSADQPGHGGSMDHVAFAAACGSTEGLQSALKDAGLDAGHYELHSAVFLAMDAPRAAERWAAGEPVFDGCARVTSERLRDR